VRVLVSGGTGFVGAPLCRVLREAGHDVAIVTREPARLAGAAIRWDDVGRAIADHDAVVNLAGEPIATTGGPTRRSGRSSTAVSSRRAGWSMRSPPRRARPRCS